MPDHVRRLVETGALIYTETGCGGVCNVALQIMLEEAVGQEIGCVGPTSTSCPRSDTSEITLLYSIQEIE